MNVKGLVISSSENDYNTFDCDISIPALKIHMEEEDIKTLNLIMPKAQYTNVTFLLDGNPVEVGVYRREDNTFYANAKEVSKLDLTRYPALGQNTLVQKHLGTSDSKSQMKKKKF